MRALPGALFCVNCGSQLDDCNRSADRARNSKTDTAAGEDPSRAPRSPHRVTPKTTWDPTADIATPAVASASVPGRDATVIFEPGYREAAGPSVSPKKALLSAWLVSSGGIRIQVVIRSENERFVLGRDESLCDATVQDPRVSRVHAAIGIVDDTALVEDLGSANGTFMNGRPVKMSHPLRDGDCIRIGHTNLVFRVE